MSIKSKIETMVRNKQRGLRISKGDQFWRGGVLVVVVKLESDKVTYKELDTGRRNTDTRRGFVSRALIRAPQADIEAGDLFRRAWAVIGTRALPAEYRLKAARAFVKQAKDMKVKGAIQRWLYALSMGKEPKK